MWGGAKDIGGRSQIPSLRQRLVKAAHGSVFHSSFLSLFLFVLNFYVCWSFMV